MAPLVKLVRPAVRAAEKIGVRRYGGHESHELAKFSEVPVPQGSWSEAYSKKSARGNIILIVGTVLGALCSAHAWSIRLKPLEKKDFPYNPSK